MIFGSFSGEESGLANLAQERPRDLRLPIAPDPGSYQQIWDVLWDSCVAMGGEDACSRLLGHTPFVCPVEKPRSILIPVLVGVVIGKLIL